MNWLQASLRFFTSLQRQKLEGIVTEERFNNLPEETQNDIIYLFSRVTSETSRQSMDVLYDYLIRAVLFDGLVKVFRVNQGEDFDMIIEREPEDDYTGYIIVARENQTNKKLSEPKEGSIDEEQEISFVDLNLEAGEFYKVRVQLEEDDGTGDTTGEGLSLLASIYFVVVLNIDEE